ncbi:unnamed protein product [Mytilus coruscus]|uniref:Uncharacterized protein n=1 Tax=Mytilus coruscus TaxID=42192 RepID=A0A6J8BME8_MYTCO|nr:unnamed protein product [Mytilus coruscus]
MFKVDENVDYLSSICTWLKILKAKKKSDNFATGSAQKGNDNTLPFGGVLYLYNNETIKILAPGPKDCSRPECTGSLVYLGNSSIFHGNSSITRSFSEGNVRARVWRACSLPRPQFISDEIPMSSGNFKSLTHRQRPTWVIVRVHIEQGWVYEAQGSVFYETSSSPFGGVVFAFNDSEIRLWVPKRGPGPSKANGVPFNAINGWGESGEFGYSETVRVRAFVWNFKSFDYNPIVLKQTSYITSSSFISVPAGYSFQDKNKLLLFSSSEYVLLVYLFIFPESKHHHTVEIKRLIHPFQTKAESGNNEGYQFYPAGSLMTDGTTNSNNTKFGSFVYGFTDDKIYYWAPEVSPSGCVLLLDGLWGSQNQQQCLSKSANDVALMIKFNVLENQGMMKHFCNKEFFFIPHGSLSQMTWKLVTTFNVLIMEHQDMMKHFHSKESFLIPGGSLTT